MDLQISVFLLVILFTAGHSHMCYECLTYPCTDKPVLCPSGNSKCLSKTMVVQIGNITFSSKTKGCTTKCESGSINLDFVKLSTSCCDSNFCNTNNAPDPRSLVPNGKLCYTCDRQSCSNIMRCSGSEDRCITSTETSEGQSTVLKGCISEVICNAIQSAGIKNVSCCEGNLCNKEESFTLDRDEAVTHSSIYNSYKSDADESFTHSIKYDGVKSVFQGLKNNAAPSVVQSFTFLCCCLLSFIFIT